MKFLFFLSLCISLSAFGIEEIVGQSFMMKDLKGAKYRNTIFVDCDFSFANLEDAEFNEVSFINSRLLNTNFTKARLNNVLFVRSDLGGSNFRNATLANVEIKKSRAPKLSFWKANATNLTFENSYILSLDASEATLENIKIKNSNIDDSVFYPKYISTIELQNTNSKTAKFSKNVKLLQYKNSVDVNFELKNTDVKILKAPTISKKCQKKYPITKNGRPQNGTSFLTDGETGGFGFNPCLNEIQFEVEVNYNDWPKKVRNSLVLEIVTDQDSSHLKSDLPSHHMNHSIFLEYKKANNKIAFRLSSEKNVTVYEIKLVTRPKR